MLIVTYTQKLVITWIDIHNKSICYYIILLFLSYLRQKKYSHEDRKQTSNITRNISKTKQTHVIPIIHVELIKQMNAFFFFWLVCKYSLIVSFWSSILLFPFGDLPGLNYSECLSEEK